MAVRKDRKAAVCIVLVAVLLFAFLFAAWVRADSYVAGNKDAVTSGVREYVEYVNKHELSSLPGRPRVKLEIADYKEPVTNRQAAAMFRLQNLGSRDVLIILDSKAAAMNACAGWQAQEALGGRKYKQKLITPSIIEMANCGMVAANNGACVMAVRNAARGLKSNPYLLMLPSWLGPRSLAIGVMVIVAAAFIVVVNWLWKAEK